MKKVLLALVMVSVSAFAHARELPDFTELVEKQGPAVVNISTTQLVANDAVPSQLPNLPKGDPLYDFLRRFGPPHNGPREFEAHSLGSGFIISTDGYILTNAHVVDDADEVTVRLTDKREFKAKVIGSDKRSDVAVIKIQATGLPKVSFGNPDQLKPGEWVVAIGSPFGFDNSVTAGIVSAKGRALPQENYVPFIQTDVAINPGNSGGPLFNMKGEVVGINSQIYSRSGGFMGLSFAIPIDVALDVSNQLRASGKVSRGWLGVVIQEVNADLAESFGLGKPTGALIAGVEKGSPADKAGLEPSDVVLKFDGKPVTSSVELPRLVGAVKPGTQATIQVWRKGVVQDMAIVVGEAPTDKVALQSGNGGKSANRLGLALHDLSEEQKKALRVVQGVVVLDAEGPAARVGIRRGDVITAINNRDVTSVDQFNEIVAGFKAGQSVALLVRRGGNSLFVALKVK